MFPTLDLMRMLVLTSVVCALPLAGVAQDKVTFDDHAKPILKQRCASCHNPNKKSGGLDVTNYTNLMQGGGSGSSIEPGDTSESYLYLLVTHEEEPVMPPSGTKIPDAEIQLLAKWISGGALETKSSVARITKPKFDMSAGANPNARPEVAPTPPKLSLEPLVTTKRAANASAIATNPWSPVVAVGLARHVLLYNTSTLQPLGVLPFPEGQVYKLKFSRNGSILLAGGGKDGASGKVVGWDIRTGDRVFEIGDELDAVMAADISTDHSMVALGGPSKMIRVYSTSDSSLVYEIKKHTEWVTAIEFSPDGVLLATGDRNGGLHIWEAETGNEYLTLKGHTKQISAVSWRVDGNVLASTSEDTTTRLWEMENGKQVKSWGSHGGGSSSVDFTRDGKVLTAGRDRQIKLWQQDGKLLQQFGGLADIAISCAYCDESARVLGGDWSGVLRVWNSADKAHVGDLATNPPLLAHRVVWSTQTRDAMKTKYTPVETAFHGLTNQLAELNQKLNSTSTMLQTTQTEMAADQNLLTSATQALETANAEQAKVTQSVNAKTAAIPLLKDSLTKANEAVQRLPDDADLKNTAAQLQARIKAIEAELVQHQNGLLAAQQKTAAAKTKVDQLTAQVAQRQSKMNEMTKQVNQMQAQKTPLEKQVADKKVEFDAVSNQLKAAEAQVVRWQNEVKFSESLKALQKQLLDAENTYVTEAEKVAEARKRLDEAQAAFNQASKNQDSARSAVETVQQQIYKAKGIQ